MLLPKQLDPDVFLAELRDDRIGIVNAMKNGNVHTFCDKTGTRRRVIEPMRDTNQACIQEGGSNFMEFKSGVSLPT
jgi:hypothetical protein